MPQVRGRFFNSSNIMVQRTDQITLINIGFLRNVNKDSDHKIIILLIINADIDDFHNM